MKYSLQPFICYIPNCISLFHFHFITIFSSLWAKKSDRLSVSTINTKIEICKYKYTNTNTQIQIRKYKYTDTNPQMEKGKNLVKKPDTPSISSGLGLSISLPLSLTSNTLIILQHLWTAGQYNIVYIYI